MTRVHVLVEGQTEETFVTRLLLEPLAESNTFIKPILVRTSSLGRGGVTSYSKIRTQLTRLCKQDKTAYVSTMFDLFRLPNDFPGIPESQSIIDPLERAVFMESALSNNINETNFIPFIVVHEFEGILFSDPSKFKSYFGEDAVQKLLKIREGFPSPEHINCGHDSAPSIRIMSICKKYNKPFHGTTIALDIGLAKILEECKHFSEWFKKLEAL